MEQLVYVSTPRGVLSKSNWRDILAVSRANNCRDGLTGLLIAGDKRVLQVLEGPTQALDHTFDRIRLDARQFSLVVLWRTHIDKRSFPDWPMGYERDDIIADDRGLSEFLDENSRAISDRSLLAELQGFARLTSKAA